MLGVDPDVPDIGDATAYHLLADGIAEGDGYLRPFDRREFGIERPTAEYAPLHPTVLAVADAAGIDGVQGQRLWLSLFGAAAVVITGVLAWRVSGGSEVAAVLAAGIAAVHPLWFQADATLMPETLTILLGGATVLLIVEAARRRTTRWWAAAGAAAGLAALTRGEAALLVLVAAAAAAAVAAGSRSSWRVALVPVVAFAVVLLPWTVRNAVRFEAFVPISTNVGSVLDGANCPATYGGPLLGYWSYSPGCFEGFLQDELAAADEAAVAAAHRRAGIEFAVDHAGDWPRVVAARLARTVAVFRPTQLADLGALEGRDQDADVAGYVLLWATLAGAVVGAARLRRARSSTWWIPAAAVVLVWGSTALSYGNPRFLAAAQPSLVALAACSITGPRATSDQRAAG